MLWASEDVRFVLKERVRRLHPVSHNIRHSSVNLVSCKPFCVLNRNASCKHPIGELFVVIFSFSMPLISSDSLVITKAQEFISSLALVHVQTCTDHNTIGLTDAFTRSKAAGAWSWPLRSISCAEGSISSPLTICALVARRWLLWLIDWLMVNVNFSLCLTKYHARKTNHLLQ
jgi:hypothetical protein